VCNEDDPQPELVAEARGETSRKATKTALSSPAKTETPQKDAAASVVKSAAEASSDETESKVAEAARPAAEDAKTDGAAAQRFALGASAMVTASTSPASPAVDTKPAAASPPVTLLNAQPSESNADAPVEVASVAGAAKDAGKPDAKAPAGKCRVWTASYGGNKAIIIKAMAEKTVNYTVLDVNEGTEKREADAYISAYAKGGEAVGEFPSQSQALEKAFELCPEG
jgi:hypothetical protein